MSTTKKPLKYLWSAEFSDGHIIRQPEDDRYSKHDDKSEWNPSSFRDLLEYPSDIVFFSLNDVSDARRIASDSVDLRSGMFYHNLDKTAQKGSMKATGPRKLIYYRNVDQKYIDGQLQEPEVAEYVFGYEFKNKNGVNEQRLVTLQA